MLLTVALLSKGSLFGSLINKCRQVVRIKNVKPIETNLKPNISTSPNVDIPHSSVIVNTVASNTNRPASVANISLRSSAAATSRSLEEQAGMPPRPKRPLTPYFRFMKEQRAKLQSDSNLTVVEIVKQIAKQWQAADASLKQRLQEEYKQEQQKYVEIRTKYDAKITDEQRSQLKDLKQVRSDAKDRRMLRKRVLELGRPKRPASAFILFTAKQNLVNPRTPKQTFREWLQQTTAKWSAFTEEEKSVYIQESRKAMEKYKKEITLWEEKMIRLGHIDVVRHSNLIDPPEPKPKK